MIGEMIGSYKVLSQIGEGGMGAVYLAEHPLIGRKVAIKVILPEHSHQKEALTRFFNEARATARLRHPGLVDTIDFGTHTNGSAYIIMEYLEGENLGARLRRVTKMTPWEAVRIARQIAEAASVAHAARIVHRDLKPDNVFLTPHPSTGDDHVKILDFGIAKLSGPDGGSGQTRTGVMVGTPLFMAPEQCRGAGQVDHRADIYSLGCILYRMVCGQLPFTHEGIGELIAAHMFETPVAPRVLAPELPPAVEALIIRAMAKRPEDRQQTMVEVVQELDAVIAALTTTANAAAGGRTMVLEVASNPPSSPRPISRPGGVPAQAATSAPSRPNLAPAPAAPASPASGGTQVLQPLPAPARSPEESQRLRKSTFSGSTAVVDNAGTASRKAKGKGRTVLMASVALAVVGVAGVVSLGGKRENTARKAPTEERQPIAVPAATAPATPAPPVSPAPPPSEPPPPPAATRPKPAEEAKAIPAESPARAAPVKEPVSSRHAAAVTKPSAAAPRSKSIHINVANAPDDLAVLVDGRPGRLPIKLPMDLKPHTLRFESARTRAEIKTITADQDQTLQLINKPKLLIE